MFQVMLVFQNAPASVFDLREITVTPLKIDSFTTKFDLNFHWSETPQGLMGTLYYNIDLFNQATIARMLEHFQILLEDIAKTPDKRVSALRLLTETECRRRFAHGSQVHPVNSFMEFEKHEQSICDRFKQIVEQYPNNIAVKTLHHTWNYRELHDKANRVAQRLLERVDASEKIALLFEHDAPMLVSILGVLKAGKTYVPLDPAFPQERLAFILQNSQASVVLSNDKSLTYAQTLTKGVCLLINIDDLNLTAESSSSVIHAFKNSVSPDTIACMLYTSGSTGQPKGVLQNHRNVLHFIRNYTNHLHITKDDRLTLLSSYSFDAAIVDIFAALLNGATLNPINLKEDSLNNLSKRLIEQEITIYHSTPTVYRHFVSAITGEDKFPSLRFVVLGGEQVKRSDVEQYKNHFATDCLFVNLFGSAESSINSFCFINKQTEITRHAVPVGYSIDETEMLLVNEAGEETEVYGEIAISSPFPSG